MPKTQDTAHQNVTWDFSDVYRGDDDPKLKADLKACLKKMADFAEKYRGRLATHLGDALEALIEIEELQNKTHGYLMLRSTLDVDDENLRKILSKTMEELSTASAKHLTFFDHEVAHIAEETYANLKKQDDVVAHHTPFLDKIRKNAQYLLDEKVEAALAARSPFGSHSWDDFMEEACAKATFEINGKPLKMEEVFDALTSAKTQEERIKIQTIFNTGLKEQGLTRLMAQSLNVVMGEKMVNDAERGYTHPMQARNISNMVADETVEALIQAVKTTAKPLGQRFYKLKAKLLEVEKLHWADRNAPLPFSDETKIPWEEGFNEVKQAFADFSPTLHNHVLDIEKKGWIDAPVTEGKRGGAFCSGLAFPGNEPHAYVLLNHLGKRRDFATLAHELGHAVHDMLAIPEQGALQWHPPMAYAETASIFAELLTFERLKKNGTTKAEKAGLIADKCNDFLNTVLRQISFCEFERNIHLARREGGLTQEEFKAAWLKTTEEYYGKNGETFIQEDMENLWCYVWHFFSPFYVYAYAFGELFTHSLYAVKDDFGDKFEGMYLNLLKAGNTKNAVALMKPFGLNPTDPTFWQRGIEGSFGVWLKELEELCETL